jgi:hypothetical protein
MLVAPRYLYQAVCVAVAGSFCTQPVLPAHTLLFVWCNYHALTLQDAVPSWQPSDLLPLKVYRQYPRKFSAPRAQRDQALAAAPGGRPPSNKAHVAHLLAQARAAEECAPACVCIVCTFAGAMACFGGLHAC